MLLSPYTRRMSCVYSDVNPKQFNVLTRAWKYSQGKLSISVMVYSISREFESIQLSCICYLHISGLYQMQFARLKMKIQQRTLWPSHLIISPTATVGSCCLWCRLGQVLWANMCWLHVARPHVCCSNDVCTNGHNAHDVCNICPNLISFANDQGC